MNKNKEGFILLVSGEECEHKGCLKHVSVDCECGRRKSKSLLYTKDGRKIGNAELVGREVVSDRYMYRVVTDCGYNEEFTYAEIFERFHMPHFFKKRIEKI